MKYKYLLFDADNTLFDFFACEKKAFSEALSLCNIEEKPGMEEAYSLYNDRCWKELERGEITKPELVVKRYRLLLEKYGLKDDPALVNSTYENCLSHTAIVFEGAEEMLERLSKKAEIYIITNGLTHVQHGRFALVGITKYIKEIFISEQMGSKKPDALFFEEVAKRIPGFRKEEAIVIGDSLSSDIKGAENAGLDCLWFNLFGNEVPKGRRITHISENFADMEAFLTE